MPAPDSDPRLRTAARLLRAFAWMVPTSRRDDWENEWLAEAWHFLEAHRGASHTVPLVLRMLGALPHAIALRLLDWRLDMLMQDLKYAWRHTTRRPSFAIVVVAVLALGIGATATMFTIVNSVLIQPLPYPHGDQLLLLNGSFAKNDEAAISPPDFLDYRDANTVFSSFAARTDNRALLTGTGEAEQVPSASITANYFSTLGVKPIAGRTFVPAEENPGSHPTAIISYALWRRRYGSNSSVIGSNVLINGKPTEIVGIMPPLLDKTLTDELWQPIVFHGENTSTRRFHFLRAIARLKPGVTIAGAQAAMDRVARSLATTYPENESWHLRIRPYRDVVVGGAAKSLVLLLGAVGLVLLIACGNVAALLLARATSRQGEIALRTALGASRTRLVRQLLTESMLFAAAGGIGGLALAALFVQGVRALGGGILPRIAEISIDTHVLLFTVCISALTGIIFGVAPALHAVRQNLSGALASSGRGGAQQRRSVRLRDVLVTAQVAFSMLLLVGAGLLLRSLWELQHVDPGFRADHVLTADLAIPGALASDSLALTRYWTDVTEQARQIPGVVSASATTMLPLQGGGDTYYWIAGHAPASQAERRNAMINTIAPGYFEALQIPVTSGRSIAAADNGNAPHVIVISATMAANLFPGESAVGKQLVVDFGDPFTATIIGVVGDVREFGLNAVAPPTIYFSYQQVRQGTARPTIVVRTRNNSGNVSNALRSAVVALNHDVPLPVVHSMDDVVGASMADLRFQSWLFGGFALTALLLAVMGLYGVLAFVVTLRSREIGVRLALGAQRSQIFLLVLRRGVVIVGLGLAVGLAAAIAGGSLLASQLFQVQQGDPLVLLVASAALGLAGFIASVAPASRAMRLDPQAVLRRE